MASAPLDDLGRHELILRAYRSGDRFCFHYTEDGHAHVGSPIILTHPGETFAIRVVDELVGNASGATMPASKLQPCMPKMTMKYGPQRHFVGYMGHEMIERPTIATDIDVNLHMHGFEGSPNQDDVFESALSTPAHACEYVFTIPPTQPPGTYFYHPHAHGMASDEVSGGLSGMWIVEPKTPAIPKADQHAIVISYRVPFVKDYAFGRHYGADFIAGAKRFAAMRQSTPIAFDPFDPPPQPAFEAIRAGNVRLPACGSRVMPRAAIDGVDAPATLTVPAGSTQLLRVLNAFSDSIAFLRMRDAQGHDVPLDVVGRDGVPVGGDNADPLGTYDAQNQVPVAPAGRIDVLLTLQPGQRATLYGAPACTAPGDELKIPHDYVTIVAGPPAATPEIVASRPLDRAHDATSQLVAYVRAHPALVRKRAFTYTEYFPFDATGRGLDEDWYLTETSDPNFVEKPFMAMYAPGAKMPMPTVVVKQGTIEEWYLFNTTMEIHSFHIHQMSFVDLTAQGGPERLDTTVIPFGTFLPNAREPNFPLLKPSLTKVLLDFRNVPKGTFVFHCHMLFHEDNGMMGVIKVV
ncbi:MAG: multicopper oxidase family protein [bacterium]|nr:multicopper oxidase family protein [bacterium]